MKEAAGVRIVTVSATYGSGGSVIAPRLAERLGLAFADRLILPRDAPAPTSGSEEITEEERVHAARSGILARLVHLTGGMGFPVPAGGDFVDPVRERVETSISELVAAGGAVILGRGATVVLANDPRAFHVRLDGPPARRVARAVALERIDQDTARSRLEQTDRARARYIERLYGRQSTDPSLYHLVLDSTAFTAEDCIDLVIMAANGYWNARHG